MMPISSEDKQTFQFFDLCFKLEMVDNQAWYFPELVGIRDDADYKVRVDEDYKNYIENLFAEFKRQGENDAGKDIKSSIKKFVDAKVAENKQLKKQYLQDVFKDALQRLMLTEDENRLLNRLELHWDAKDISPERMRNRIATRLNDVLLLRKFFDDLCQRSPLTKAAWSNLPSSERKQLEIEHQANHREAQCSNYFIEDVVDCEQYQKDITHFIEAEHLAGKYPNASWRRSYKDSLVRTYKTHWQETETFEQFVNEVAARLQYAPTDFINSEIKKIMKLYRGDEQKRYENDFLDLVIYFCRFPGNTIGSNDIGKQLQHDLEEHQRMRQSAASSAHQKSLGDQTEMELQDFSRHGPSGRRR